MLNKHSCCDNVEESEASRVGRVHEAATTMLRMSHKAMNSEEKIGAEF